MKDLIRIHTPVLKRKDLEYVLESMINDTIDYGVYAKSFENKLAERVGVKFSLALNSLYTAIDLLFETLELDEDDEIILPSWAPRIYLDLCIKRKLKPVLVDLAAKSYFPDINAIHQVLTDKTKAIILIHQFGYTIDATAFENLGPILIEDITKVPGANAGSKNAGHYGTYAIASFSSSEIITTGEGAMIFTQSKKEHQKLLNKVFPENQSEYQPLITGLIPDLNASMGLSQLLSLEKRLDLKQKISAIFEESIAKSRATVISPHENTQRYYSDFPFQVSSSIKDSILFYKKNGVELLRPYEKPLHHYLGLDNENFPETEKMYLSTLLLPSSSSLLKEKVEHISKLIIAMI